MYAWTFRFFQWIFQGNPKKLEISFLSIKSNAFGSDSIFTFILKLCSLVITPYITHLINILNCYLYSGWFHNNWKEVLGSPIPKISSPRAFSDLRPISLLAVLGQLLEKVVYRQSNIYFTKISIILSQQSGFRRKGYSFGRLKIFKSFWYYRLPIMLLWIVLLCSIMVETFFMEKLKNVAFVTQMTVLFHIILILTMFGKQRLRRILDYTYQENLKLNTTKFNALVFLSKFGIVIWDMLSLKILVIIRIPFASPVEDH